MTPRKPVIGVMGGHAVDDATTKLAYDLGAAIAAEAWILLNGGRDEGVMVASTRGARDAGGFVIGIHPGRREDGGAADADVVIWTDIGYARNAVNVLSSDVVVALPGSSGTLSEAAYAVAYGRPLILLGFDDHGAFPDAVRAADVAACIEAIKTALRTMDAPGERRQP